MSSTADILVRLDAAICELQAIRAAIEEAVWNSVSELPADSCLDKDWIRIFLGYQGTDRDDVLFARRSNIDSRYRVRTRVHGGGGQRSRTA